MRSRVAVDAVGAHNERMWERLAKAGIPYTRPQGTPPGSERGKRRFLDPFGRLAGLTVRGKRVLALAAGGGWHAVLFAELGAETTLFDISARQLRTVRELARARGVRLRIVRGDMRDLSRFPDAWFDIVWHSHSLVFVPDAARVIAEVGRVLAPGGIYRASTMHPVALRMYEGWTGNGWSIRKSYFDDGPLESENTVWRSGDISVDAPTLEYGHRISDLVNACASAGMVIDGLWEWSPGEISTRAPVRPARANAGAPPGSDRHLDSVLPACLDWRARKLRPAAPDAVRSAAAAAAPARPARRAAGGARSRASRSGSRRGTASRPR
ncbi:MAG: class I SAM-dependent methyltransferase [Candidatus Limnocylindria bacterium]